MNAPTLEQIFEAIDLLQKAGLDTTSVTMSLTFLLDKQTKPSEPSVQEEDKAETC